MVAIIIIPITIRNSTDSFSILKNIVLPGFEPGSQGPKPCMLDHYTTGLQKLELKIVYKS